MPGKTESILIQKGVSIYKQPKSDGRGSPNWYARIYMSIGGKKLHVKSTGTTDEKLARRFAENFFGECLVTSKTLAGSLPALLKNGIIKVDRFEHIADQFLEQLKTYAGNDSRRLRNCKDHFGAMHGAGGLATFFKGRHIGSIGTDDIRKYLQFANSKSRKGVLATASQKRILSSLSQVLKFACEKRLLTTLPLMPRIKLKDNPRPWFEKAEYQKLYKTAFGLRDAAKKKGDTTAFLKWAELGDFIVFMVGSFLRPGEWANLKPHHIKHHKANAAQKVPPFLEITVLNGKTGDRQSVTMQTSIAPYKRMLSRNGSDLSAYILKSAYLNRQTAKERMADAFSELMIRTNLTLDAEGNRRSIYSLRHTSLMLRITEGGVDVLRLAQNAGTSVQMIERFYLKNLKPRTGVVHLQRFL